jgi:mevalonate kinase
MLFGEYSILLGSDALGMPFQRYGGTLIKTDQGGLSQEQERSNRMLAGVYEAFCEPRSGIPDILELDRLGEDIRTGLFFQSDIPIQYGMGSSGALCAALYDAYARPGLEDADNPMRLRQRLGTIESVFHGTSSGFDPLISRTGSALALKSGGQINPTDLSWLFTPSSGLTTLLLDSGSPCSTRSLVGSFLQAFSDHGPRSAEGALYKSLVNESITFIMDRDLKSLYERIRMIGVFQLTALPEQIPATLAGLWRQGMETGLFSLKLCGSGGGGFTFCFTRRPDETMKMLDQAGISRILISSS